MKPVLHITWKSFSPVTWLPIPKEIWGVYNQGRGELMGYGWCENEDCLCKCHSKIKVWVKRDDGRTHKGKLYWKGCLINWKLSAYELLSLDTHNRQM